MKRTPLHAGTDHPTRRDLIKAGAGIGAVLAARTMPAALRGRPRPGRRRRRDQDRVGGVRR